MKPLFLPRPSAIRSALHDSIARASKLDFAVAFVGHDWQDILGSARVPLRVVCWLTSTNTNPFAVRQLMSRLGTTVKQMDRMHAKVYYARCPSVHTLARVRIARRVAAPIARLATGWGDLPLRRKSFAPAGRHTEFHEFIA